MISKIRTRVRRRAQTGVAAALAATALVVGNAAPAMAGEQPVSTEDASAADTGCIIIPGQWGMCYPIDFYLGL
jgi:hypothetical protein